MLRRVRWLDGMPGFFLSFDINHHYSTHVWITLPGNQTLFANIPQIRLFVRIFKNVICVIFKGAAPKPQEDFQAYNQEVVLHS